MSFRHGIHPKYTGRFLLFLFKAIIFFPFYLLESIGWSRAYAKTTITHPPVFILGHHRSGTTLIHKLLAMDPGFCYFQNSDIVLPRIPGGSLFKRILRMFVVKLKIKTFAYNNVLFDLNDPQEEDMCMAGMFEPENFYWAFVFPKNYSAQFCKQDQNKKMQQWKQAYLFHLKRIQFHNKEKTLLLKNPPNTARIAALVEMFPNAKFIFINRGTSDVVYSALRLWKKGLKAFSMQKFNDGLIETKVFDYYKKFYSLFQKDKQLINAVDLMEINYEELRKDPLIVIKKIYVQFNWNFKPIEALMAEKINEEKTYKTFEYTHDEELDKKISALKNEIDIFSNVHQNIA